MGASLVSFLKNTFGGTAAGRKPEWVSRYDAYRGAVDTRWVCHAPFKSMYFGHGGKIVTCCYNRNYVLGHYPERSIRDTWFGPEADRLREYIRQNDLQYGCEGCRSMLMAGNYEAVKARQYDGQRLNANSYPSVMEFELSNECNLGCVMCTGEFSSYIRKHVEKKPALDSVYGSAFLEQLEDFIPYLEETKFYGGEPFLIPVYQDIWDRLIALNPHVRISVQTNATVLSARVKRQLEGGLFHMNISIDSLQKERYESIRRNAVFEKVMENIRYLRDYTARKNTFFGLSFCLMRNNWDEAADFIRFCNETGAKAYFHTVYEPDRLALKTWDTASLQAVTDTFADTVFDTDTDLHRENARHFGHWLLQVKEWATERRTPEPEVDLSLYLDTLRNRVKMWNDPAAERLLLQRLQLIEQRGLGNRKLDVTRRQLNDKAWADHVIRLLVSKTDDEILQLINHG